MSIRGVMAKNSTKDKEIRELRLQLIAANADANALAMVIENHLNTNVLEFSPGAIREILDKHYLRLLEEKKCQS